MSRIRSIGVSKIVAVLVACTQGMIGYIAARPSRVHIGETPERPVSSAGAPAPFHRLGCKTQNGKTADIWGCVYRYIETFTLMAQAIKALQITEGEYVGFWGPSLRAFDLFPTPESSGTAFFVSGFAYGIAEGILSPDEYLPVRLCDFWNPLPCNASMHSGACCPQREHCRHNFR